MQTTGVDVVEKRDRAVLHLARRVRLRRDVGDLLQLQRPLEGDRQADVATEVEEEGLLVVTLRDLLDRMVGVQVGAHLVRERTDLLQEAGDLVVGKRAPNLGELQRHQVT